MPEFPPLLSIRTDREYRLICERIGQLEGKPPSPIRAIELRRLKAVALRYAPHPQERHMLPAGAKSPDPLTDQNA